MPDVENHFAADLFADRHLENVAFLPIAAVGEDMRAKLRELAADAHVFRVGSVPREHHLVHAFYRLENFPPLFPPYKHKTLFLLEPVVVIQNHHELVAEFPRLPEKPNMADVHGVESAAHGHHNRPSSLFILSMLHDTSGIYSLTRGSFILISTNQPLNPL